VFSGAYMDRKKMVWIGIARILRRWKPLYEQDLGTMLDAAIQVLKDKANQPPRICGDGGMRSRWETLAFQSSEQGSAVVIQPDDMTHSDNCHTTVGDVFDDRRPLGLV